MTPPVYRNIAAERRSRAAECVARHIAEFDALMADAGVACRTLEGSAVAAEVFLAETNTLHTAVRVGVAVRPVEQPGLETALVRADFDPCEPSGDTTLLRLAAREGRRAVHVLFGLGEDLRADADRRGDGGDGHPGDPHGVRERSRRLHSAFVDLVATFRRVRHAADEHCDVTESFEIQVIHEMPTESSPALATRRQPMSQ